MDSVFDRAGEGVVYVGIAAGCVAADFDAGRDPRGGRDGRGLHGQLRPGEVGEPRLHARLGHGRVGLAPREVRIVILTIGLLLAGALGGVQTSAANHPLRDRRRRSRRPVLAVALGLITILATITAIQRIVHVIRQSPQE